MEFLENFMDDDGFIKARGDYGDNPANLGTAYFSVFEARRLNLVPQNHYSTLTYDAWIGSRLLLESKPGLICRHPDPNSWTSSTSTMSRDQIRGYLMGAHAVGDHGFIDRFIRGHAWRGYMFTTNSRRNHAYPKGHMYYRPDKSHGWKIPDFTGLSFWAFLCRLTGRRSSKLLFLADTISIAKSKRYVNEHVETGKKTGHFGDLRNHIQHLMFCKLYQNTDENDEAIDVMRALRPQLAMDLWFSEARQEPPMGDVMRPLIQCIFGGK